MITDIVQFDRERLVITVRPHGRPELKIGKDDLRISFFSGGPGGQNVNRNMSGVRLIYRIPETHIISALKTRELTARSINERKREQNLFRAFTELAYKLHRYFYVAPERRKTHAPKASREKRMRGKRMRGQKKEARKSVLSS